MPEENNQPSDHFDKFEEQMVVVSYSSWIILITLLVLTLSLLFWAFFGSISTKVIGKGISLTTEGVLSVPSRVKGRVIKLDVQPGQIIQEKGEPIAVIFDLELEVALQNAKNKRDQLRTDYENAKKIAEEEKERRNLFLKKSYEANQFSLKERRSQIPFLIKDLNSKKKLYEEGLISASQLEQAERLLMEEEIKIEETLAELTRLETEKEKSYRSDELNNYQRLYYEAENSVKELEAKSSYLTILSPAKGKVIEVQVRIGEEIKEGQSIIWMEKPTQGKEEYIFYCYVPSEEGNKIKIGMQAELKLSIVDSQKYGYLVGTVKAVSHYPVTDIHIYSVLYSEDLVKYLTADQTAITEVIVDPKKDPSTPSGYQWTSGKGPPITLSSGLVSEVRITVKQRRPISYIFPQWWLPEVIQPE